LVRENHLAKIAFGVENANFADFAASPEKSIVNGALELLEPAAVMERRFIGEPITAVGVGANCEDDAIGWRFVGSRREVGIGPGFNADDAFLAEVGIDVLAELQGFLG